jgi:two-component system response regulator
VDSSNTQTVRILVVEDNPNDKELLRRQLRKASLGEHVLYVSDPREAVKLLRGPGCSDFVDQLVAIFLDVHLPHMTGVDLLRLLRDSDGTVELPVIMMSSCPHPDIVAECHRLKATAFVEKPVTLADFSHIIADLFHGSKQTLLA